jgi:hypothetical protein
MRERVARGIIFVCIDILMYHFIVLNRHPIMCRFYKVRVFSTERCHELWLYNSTSNINNYIIDFWDQDQQGLRQLYLKTVFTFYPN